MPLIWRAFLSGAAVVVAAAVLLIVTPITISAPIAVGELLIVIAGLAVILALDLWILHRMLAPVERLTDLMASVDPDRPGQRIAGLDAHGPEVAALARAFNEMLDRLERERLESGRLALAAQERERRRVARELHDEVGQSLTAAALQIERAADPGPDAGNLGAAADAVRASLDDVRRIARELRPEALDDLGLVNALISLCSQTAAQAGLRVERRIDGIGSVDADVELVIYRVAQESLTNVARHADATAVTVSLSRTDDEVQLTVTDDGRGLSEETPVDTVGIAGMRERARLVDGSLSVKSSPGEGTEVRLTIPL